MKKAIIGRSATGGKISRVADKKSIVIKTSQTLKAQKTMSQKIQDDIMANIDVYKRLSDK